MEKTVKRTQPPSILGRNIKYLRVASDLTQAELAQHMGVSLATIGNIESGWTLEVRASLLADLAKLFGVSMDVLMKGRLADLAEAKPKLRRGARRIYPSEAPE